MILLAAPSQEATNLQRTITGFHVDEVGDWVAELSCFHGQHVRHRPPFRDAPWVNDDAERRARIGAALECPLCDRAELPDGLHVVRTTETWDEATTPSGLVRSHRVAPGVWGLVHVEAGELHFVAPSNPALDVVLRPGDAQPIPPEQEHRVEPRPGVRFHIEFLRR
jgi:tellurite methyltransferase